MIDARYKTRNERLLSLISNGELSMETLSRIFDCPEASIRRSIQKLRADGYYIVLSHGQVKSYGLRQALMAYQDDVDYAGGDDDADYQR